MDAPPDTINDIEILTAFLKDYCSGRQASEYERMHREAVNTCMTTRVDIPPPSTPDAEWLEDLDEMGEWLDPSDA